MKILKLILALCIANLLFTSCSGSPFDNLLSAIHEYEEYAKGPGFKIDGKESWDKYTDHLHELSQKIKNAAKDVSSKPLKPKDEGHMEIVEPLTLEELEDTYESAASFKLSGKVKVTKDLEFKPFNEYWRNEFSQGKGLQLILFWVKEDGEYKRLTDAGEIPVTYENGKYFIKTGTVIDINTSLSVGSSNYDLCKAVGDGLWIGINQDNENPAFF